MLPLLLAWLALAPHAAADTLHAARPSAEPDPPWSASLAYEYLSISPTLGGWHTYGARVGRRFSRGTVSVELFQTDRFRQRDRGAVIDAYFDLWNGAYGNVRVQSVADADALPGSTIAMELFQAVGAWEVSAGAQRQRFPLGGVDLYGFALARYAGNWYVRGRTTLVSVADELSIGGSILARRYLDSADDLVDLVAGGGQEIVTLDLGPSVDVRRTAFASARVQRYVHPRLGGALRVSYQRYEGLTGRLGVGIALLTRW